MNHSSWAFSRKSTKFSAFTNSFLVAFIPTSRFYRTDFWGLWSDGRTHCETFVFRISNHYMILSVRRILEATYVMKVKLFIRSHGLKNWVMRVKWLLRNTGTLWCNQLTLSNLFSSSVRNCLSLIDHMYTFFTQFSEALIHHLRMDWLYRKRLHIGYSWRKRLADAISNHGHFSLDQNNDRMIESIYIMKVKLLILAGSKISSCVRNHFSEIQKHYDAIHNVRFVKCILINYDAINALCRICFPQPGEQLS